MKESTIKNTKKEFLENRTSWRWFERAYFDNNLTPEAKILLEILKELQHLNDK